LKGPQQAGYHYNRQEEGRPECSLKEGKCPLQDGDEADSGSRLGVSSQDRSPVWNHCLNQAGNTFQGSEDVSRQPFSEGLWVNLQKLAPEDKVRLVSQKKIECITPLTLMMSPEILEGRGKHGRGQAPLVGVRTDMLSVDGDRRCLGQVITSFSDPMDLFSFITHPFENW